MVCWTPLKKWARLHVLDLDLSEFTGGCFMPAIHPPDPKRRVHTHAHTRTHTHTQPLLLVDEVGALTPCEVRVGKSLAASDRTSVFQRGERGGGGVSKRRRAFIEIFTIQRLFLIGGLVDVPPREPIPPWRQCAYSSGGNDLVPMRRGSWRGLE